MSRIAITILVGSISALATAADPRLPLLHQTKAWARLPDAPMLAEPLPAWARALVGPYPVTTARMLELDAAHRSGDRLDARFRAIVRYSAAYANQCDYSKAMAVADFQRAAGPAADLPTLINQPERMAEIDRLGASFARRMMTNASGVTDGEVKKLIDLLGDERMVAFVQLLAHASFQDRILLALNVAPEADGVPPPVKATFGRPQHRSSGPPAEPPALTARTAPTADWTSDRGKLAGQKKRVSRIAIPPEDAMARRLGANHPTLWQNGVLWSRVCYVHQPMLTDAFFDAAHGFRQETGLDGVFGNCIFWTVTDALDCFY